MRLIWLALLFMVGCAASSHVLVGEKRPAIGVEQVKLYRTPPPRFEEIAVIEADSRYSWAITNQGEMDDVIKGMKEEAAKLGANGLLIEGTSSDAMFGKSGRGTAIYVPAN